MPEKFILMIRGIDQTSYGQMLLGAIRIKIEGRPSIPPAHHYQHTRDKIRADPPGTQVSLAYSNTRPTPHLFVRCLKLKTPCVISTLTPPPPSPTLSRPRSTTRVWFRISAESSHLKILVDSENIRSVET